MPPTGTTDLSVVFQSGKVFIWRLLHRELDLGPEFIVTPFSRYFLSSIFPEAPSTYKKTTFVDANGLCFNLQSSSSVKPFASSFGIEP